MNRIAMLTAATAALALTPAAMAGDSVDTVEKTAETPVKLVSWDGDFELLKESRRMRIWRSHLAYTLTVSAEGKVTDCAFTDAFRMRRVSMVLCDILSEHHTFEPALDASGAPVEGSYSAEVSYMELREKLGE
ncbi:MAG: hypothetical protein ACX930_00255 [Erythrobacter sp.]